MHLNRGHLVKSTSPPARSQFSASSNASCSTPLCFTRHSPGQNAEVHPAHEIIASALDHSLMRRCQLYCWELLSWSIRGNIFHRNYNNLEADEVESSLATDGIVQANAAIRMKFSLLWSSLTPVGENFFGVLWRWSLEIKPARYCLRPTCHQSVQQHVNTITTKIPTVFCPHIVAKWSSVS